MENKTVIETERLILRHTEKSDANEMLKLFSDPIAMTYFPDVKDIDGVLEWIEFIQSCYASEGYGFYTAVRKEDQKIIGYCGLILQKDVDGKDETEIGYALIRDFWKNGYASEAAIACRKYGFNVLGKEKLISLIRPDNCASIEVALKNGLQWEKDIHRWDYTHSVYSVKKEAC
ncbi:Acetyltransferase [Chitinispirillum alkaliphilum]|nr:Acetyltransferase [Chitinispirillum alkaliphilum]